MKTKATPDTPTVPAAQLLLTSQLIFNIGFYSVVPFLAVSMRDDFGMGAMAIGIVLGARTFAQQGLFLLGGAASDHWGPRHVMVTGCLTRVAGYVLLVFATDFPLFLLGAVITGIGGALFSPALESLVGGAEEQRRGDHRRGPTLFALLVITGEIGAVAGPLVGSVLLATSFDTALLTGAGIFVVMAAVFQLFLPDARRKAPTAAAERLTGVPPSSLWSCLREKRFVWFAAFYGANLLAYNQLYFGLPIELERSGAGVGSLAGVFAYASILTITLQWPIARLMRRAGPRIALRLGFGLQAIGFATVAAMAPFPPTDGLKLLPALLLVTGQSLGHMCATPVAMGLVLEFASQRPAGAYYGLLASCGGIAVLLGNAVLAPLYELASTPTLAAASPWLLTAILAATSAAVITQFLPVQSGLIPGKQELQPA